MTNAQTFRLITGTAHAPYLYRAIEGRQAVQFAYRMGTNSFEWILTRRGDDDIEWFVANGDTGVRRLTADNAEQIARDLLAQEA